MVLPGKMKRRTADLDEDDHEVVGLEVVFPQDVRRYIKDLEWSKRYLGFTAIVMLLGVVAYLLGLLFGGDNIDGSAASFAIFFWPTFIFWGKLVGQLWRMGSPSQDQQDDLVYSFGLGLFATAINIVACIFAVAQIRDCPSDVNILTYMGPETRAFIYACQEESIAQYFNLVAAFFFLVLVIVATVFLWLARKYTGKLKEHLEIICGDKAPSSQKASKAYASYSKAPRSAAPSQAGYRLVSDYDMGSETDAETEYETDAPDAVFVNIPAAKGYSIG